MKYSFEKWKNKSTLASKNYICGYCGNDINSNIGYHSDEGIKIYLCHNCGKPTFIDNKNSQTPGVLFGKTFAVAIPEQINSLYEEAKKCYSVSAYTSVGLCCRKLLMHICVQLGAQENLKFIEYVNFLDTENYIPKNSKKWVDIIRKKGNDVNHEIVILNQKEAEQLITFSGIIINLIYENELLLDQTEV